MRTTEDNAKMEKSEREELLESFLIAEPELTFAWRANLIHGFCVWSTFWRGRRRGNATQKK